MHNARSSFAEKSGSFFVETLPITAEGVTGRLEWRATPLKNDYVLIECVNLQLSIKAPPVLKAKINLQGEELTSQLVNEICALLFTRQDNQILYDSLTDAVGLRVRPLLSHGANIFKIAKTLQYMFFEELVWGSTTSDEDEDTYNRRFEKSINIFLKIPQDANSYSVNNLGQAFFRQKFSLSELDNLGRLLEIASIEHVGSLTDFHLQRMLANDELSLYYHEHRDAVNALISVSGATLYEAIVIHRHLSPTSNRLYQRLIHSYSQLEIPATIAGTGLKQGMLQERRLHDILAIHYGYDLYADFSGQWSELYREDQLSSSPRPQEFFHVGRFLNLLQVYSEGWDNSLPFDMALLLIDED